LIQDRNLEQLLLEIDNVEVQDGKIPTDPMEITTLHRYNTKVVERERLQKILVQEREENQLLMETIQQDLITEVDRKSLF
jgi:hypothetical protein